MGVGESRTSITQKPCRKINSLLLSSPLQVLILCYGSWKKILPCLMQCLCARGCECAEEGECSDAWAEFISPDFRCL